VRLRCRDIAKQRLFTLVWDGTSLSIGMAKAMSILLPSFPAILERGLYTPLL
jgi:hypothetical protein